MVREIRFVEVDEESATQEARNYGPDGSALGEPARSVETWHGFQSHASFPLTGTTIVNEPLETALGHLSCVRYTVVNGTTIDIYWFALDLPGMPVRVENHADGSLLSIMEMIENVMPESSPGPVQ
jgi:hypothetical protein